MTRAEKRRQARAAGYRRASGKRGRRPGIRSPETPAQDKLTEAVNILHRGPKRKTKLIVPVPEEGLKTDPKTGLYVPASS